MLEKAFLSFVRKRCHALINIAQRGVCVEAASKNENLARRDAPFPQTRSLNKHKFKNLKWKVLIFSSARMGESGCCCARV